ncbi:hypothetical protein V6N13_132249 [Hibiscus sabdariffa]|uniref:S1 motif domain-containing protein n=1 Tax=Hibiscus sabdariffa TaxID=183260 RepID=A0ABR2PVF7_9ROSI
MASSPSQDDALKKLEYLSLVSKVSSELESHVRISDKVLAEFITEMGRNSNTVAEFDAKLKENGAELPDYFVRTLLTIIHAILPPKHKSADKDSNTENPSDGKKSKFKALAIPDDKNRTKELEKEIEMEMQDNRDRDNDDGRGYDSWGRNRDRTRDNEDGMDYRIRGRNMDGDNVEGEEDGGRSNGKYRDNEPQLYKVYKGRVSRVMDSGCSVQLDELRGKEGLVHVSQMASRRIPNAKDAVGRDQEVYVKVISVSGQKLSLSMRDVDQNTGQDLLPLKKTSDVDAFRTNPSGGKEGPVTRTGLSGIKISEDEDAVPSRRPLKGMSSPERWEAKQLIAFGVLRVDECPMYDEDGDGMLYQEEGAEEELEIEMNEDEPAFLQGQTRYSIDMSPVKIFKNPEGSLSCAAALQSALIKERREVREHQQRAMLD